MQREKTKKKEKEIETAIIRKAARNKALLFYS